MNCCRQQVGSNEIFNDLLGGGDAKSPSTNSHLHHSLSLQEQGELLKQCKTGCLKSFISSPLVMLSLTSSASWMIEKEDGGCIHINHSPAYSKSIVPITLGEFSIPTQPVMLYISNQSLDTKLFCSLFGMDSGLCDNPVILVGLPHGKVCSILPLEAYPELMYEFNDSVCGIHTCHIKFESDRNSDTSKDNSLVLICCDGKVVMIKMDEKNETIMYLEHHIKGPVLVTDICKDGRLLHSTGTAMYLTDLTVLLNRSKESQSANKQGITISSQPCNVFGFVIIDTKGN